MAFDNHYKSVLLILTPSSCIFCDSEYVWAITCFVNMWRKDLLIKHLLDNTLHVSKALCLSYTQWKKTWFEFNQILIISFAFFRKLETTATSHPRRQNKSLISKLTVFADFIRGVSYIINFVEEKWQIIVLVFHWIGLSVEEKISYVHPSGGHDPVKTSN